jgi:hypothetical protein
MARSLAPAPKGPDGHAAAFGPKLPDFGLVPPLPFLPAPTVYSARYLAGLLHPAADHGVRLVSGDAGVPAASPRPGTPEGARQPEEAGERFTAHVPFPRRKDPSERSPRRQPCRVTTAHALSSSGTQRHRTSTIPGDGSGHGAQRRHRPQGLHPSTSPLRPARVSADWPPDAPLGFDPRENRRLAPVGLRGVATRRVATAHVAQDNATSGQPKPTSPGEPDAAHAPTEPGLLSRTGLDDRSRRDPLTRPTSRPEGRRSGASEEALRRTGRHFQHACHEARTATAPRGAQPPHPRVRRPSRRERLPPSAAGEPVADRSGVRSERAPRRPLAGTRHGPSDRPCARLGRSRDTPARRERTHDPP